jgi:hypothetical protein
MDIGLQKWTASPAFSRISGHRIGKHLLKDRKRKEGVRGRIIKEQD